MCKALLGHVNRNDNYVAKYAIVSCNAAGADRVEHLAHRRGAWFGVEAVHRREIAESAVWRALKFRIYRWGGDYNCRRPEDGPRLKLLSTCPDVGTDPRGR